MKPRCLKCGKDHATRNCHIKERQENPFCINCQDFGHSACYTKCPKFPQPKKGTAFSDPIKRKKFSSKWTKEGISFANVVSGEIPNQIPSETANLTANKKEDSSSGFLTQAHCHPPINDRSIANASCTAIGPPPPKSRPSLQAQVSKTKKIRVPDRG
ncbi:uncharacterized protein TNCV_432621 [Trichonephila clavipes]|nr:uncharacterized protein TNCV_432621 [Trichonephila clavipes]